ncbi:MAG: hypothetical protein J6S34_03865 [Clostridia bacterium]|nr:hypothetical protein [Clostridia bacterium]
MKHIWKLFLLLLCVATVVSILVACSCTDTPEAPTTTSTSGAETTGTPTTTKTEGTVKPEFTTCSLGTTGKTPTSSTATVTLPKPIDPCATHTPSAGGTYCSVCYSVLKTNEKDYLDMIYFSCDDETLTKAYQVALADYNGNVHLFKDGILTELMPCIMAGAGYDTPWTRDAAINVYNAVALLERDVAKNTLFAVLKKSGSNYLIDGQYWDAVIWSIGAYRYYTVTGDSEFLKIAQNALNNSLKRFEREEFDKNDNLFRGAAVYGDGIAAYPDRYATNIGTPGIESWMGAYPDQKVNVGAGLPMKALSTNCVYYQAYVILAQMNEILGFDTAAPLKKAEALKTAINKIVWNEEKGTYDYLAYECDYQEALGVAFVLLFDIADERQTALVLENTYVTEQGIACVWPAFDRYLALDGYGRHSGTVWPHAQGFWANACATKGYTYGFEFELYALAEKAAANGQFHEIYHPDTGEVYGGLQGTGRNDMFLWGSVEHQTWSATGYLSLIYYHILGADIKEGSVTFTPYLPTGVNEATISNFVVGNTTFESTITRGGNGISTFTYDTTNEGTVRVHMSVQ